MQLNSYNFIVKRPNILQQAVKDVPTIPYKKTYYQNYQLKLTRIVGRSSFFHDFNIKKSAVLQDVTNEIVSDLNRDFKSRFNVNFISQVGKSTKPSKIEKENTAESIKKDIEVKWKKKSVETCLVPL